MDIGAYAQIDDLEKIMTENNIVVPRLRGIRLMSEERPLTSEEIAEQVKDIALTNCEMACESGFVYNPSVFTLSTATKRLKHKYLVYGEDSYIPSSVRWENIHGKKRKLFKYLFKQAKRKVEKNLLTFNKYCGRDDILYIHARIGGGNWPYYHSEVDTKPWFIEKIDDPFDDTYCDIYARIKTGET